LSPHQIGVADLLDALHLLDAKPRSLLLLGLVPETLELGLDRSPPVEGQIPTLVKRIVGEARSLGHELLPNGDVGPSRAEGPNPAIRALGL
jgi:hydrogenase maturation protease